MNYLFNNVSQYTLDDDKTWSVFLPRAALNYKLNDNWSTYASYSKGYMPGGYNFFATSGTADDNSFEPQISSNYEIGLKAQTEKMTLGAALFYMDIEDIHIYRYKNAGANWIALTDNANKAHSMGAELEATYWLTDRLQLDASVGVIKAEYDDYDAGNVKSLKICNSVLPVLTL
uniref:Iron complex outermembrane recepter protein n=1 Tax=Candidatus Kentrum sp. FW TaxID=2126338 RepID=A0A450TZ44_9GAMM|nr:MAG: iron complex outermembrane recepter protein [Candidatus Kentron sp. FW]